MVTEVKTKFSGFRTLTPIRIHIGGRKKHEACCCLGEVSYLFLRSSFKFQGHTAKISLILTQIGRFPTVTPVCIQQWASWQIRKIVGVHAPGMPGTFSPSPQVSDPDMHHGTCVTHVPSCMPGSLTSGFHVDGVGKHSRHSRRMRNVQFYVSGNEMFHKTWSSIEEVSYCFSMSSVSFQGHTGQKMADFGPE